MATWKQDGGAGWAEAESPHTHSPHTHTHTQTAGRGRRLALTMRWSPWRPTTSTQRLALLSAWHAAWRPNCLGGASGREKWKVFGSLQPARTSGWRMWFHAWSGCYTEAATNLLLRTATHTYTSTCNCRHTPLNIILCTLTTSRWINNSNLKVSQPVPAFFPFLSIFLLSHILFVWFLSREQQQHQALEFHSVLFIRLYCKFTPPNLPEFIYRWRFRSGFFFCWKHATIGATELNWKPVKMLEGWSSIFTGFRKWRSLELFLSWKRSSWWQDDTQVPISGDGEMEQPST